MKVVRKKTYETNSSSMHSIVVTKSKDVVNETELVGDGYNPETVYLHEGKLNLRHELEDGYGRYPFEILSTFEDKLKYAMCEYMGYLYADDPEFDKYYNEFKDICEEVIPGFVDFDINTREERIYLDANGNEIPHKDINYEYDIEAKKSIYTYIENGEKKLATVDKAHYLEQPNIGIIDHQSMGHLDGFLTSHGITLKDFLTNKKYIIIVDGDEYCSWDNMKHAGIVDTSNIVEEY